jgi:hypothetical protein
LSHLRMVSKIIRTGFWRANLSISGSI